MSGLPSEMYAWDAWRNVAGDQCHMVLFGVLRSAVSSRFCVTTCVGLSFGCAFSLTKKTIFVSEEKKNIL